MSDLPDGYDTPAGERGARLSGCQRQRIAIVRALRTARAGRTTLVVAHRPSTLRTAHTVVLLEEGRVVDSGPHDELLARCPAYRRLLNERAPRVG
ncbi:hypothetical protein IAG44_39425 [Streptomyces roseirectus]|uniref:Uncharacterized protein n=1 Tax=Streptomyces roseirectus TaxID=2768066 RepID=A0A7H0IQ38_9ACTN|nr:hypothetical protein [Streptomyces roseirectus]QNP74904.1 hypothetical protein IAG44_39425 [Streptomyces roseirectus]